MFFFSNDFEIKKLFADNQLYTVSKMAEAEDVNGPPYHKTTNAGLFLLYLSFPLRNQAYVIYTAIFHGCKNDNFQLKICVYFHIFAQNIDYGYTLEPPH